MIENKESYLGNPLIKRDGIVQQWDKKDLTEYMKCSKDPVYFAKNYVKVIHVDKGLVPFDLYPYQEDMFKHFYNDTKLLEFMKFTKKLKYTTADLQTFLFKYRKCDNIMDHIDIFTEIINRNVEDKPPDNLYM